MKERQNMKNIIQEIFFKHNPWHEYDIKDYESITENVLSMNKEEVEQFILVVFPVDSGFFDQENIKAMCQEIVEVLDENV